MTTTRLAGFATRAARGSVAPGHPLPVLVSRHLTRRRVIDQMRTASATCR